MSTSSGRTSQNNHSPQARNLSSPSLDPELLLPLPPRRAWTVEDVRKRGLENDSDAYDVGPHDVTCRGCHRSIRLNITGRYYASNWNKHKTSCKALQSGAFEHPSQQSRFSGRVPSFRLPKSSRDSDDAQGDETASVMSEREDYNYGTWGTRDEDRPPTSGRPQWGQGSSSFEEPNFGQRSSNSGYRRSFDELEHADYRPPRRRAHIAHHLPDPRPTFHEPSSPLSRTSISRSNSDFTVSPRLNPLKNQDRASPPSPTTLPPLRDLMPHWTAPAALPPESLSHAELAPSIRTSGQSPSGSSRVSFKNFLPAASSRLSSVSDWSQELPVPINDRAHKTRSSR